MYKKILTIYFLLICCAGFCGTINQGLNFLWHCDGPEDSQVFTPEYPSALSTTQTNIDYGGFIGVNEIQSGGKFNQCYYSGSYYTSENYIKHTFTNPIAVGYSDFTIDFWLKVGANPSTGQGYGTVYDMTDLKYRFEMSYTGIKYMRLRFDGSSFEWFTTTDYADDTWHHFAFVRQALSLKVYIDGIEIQSLTLTTLNASNIDNLTFGDRYPSAAGLLFHLDEFRMANYATWTTNFTPPSKPYTRVSSGLTFSNNGTINFSGSGEAQFSGEE